MKRRITIPQAYELTRDQMMYLHKWWQPAPGDTVHPNMEPDQECVVIAVSDDGVSLVMMFKTVDGKAILLTIEKTDCVPLLDIGQCIEFLQDVFSSYEVGLVKGEPLDTMWEMVKEKIKTNLLLSIPPSGNKLVVVK